VDPPRVLEALVRVGGRPYGGEPVTELEHALQCAELAEAGGADGELVLACLLHDVGRYAVPSSLLSDSTSAADAVSQGPHRRRGHHELGAELLAPWVAERVAWCVRMHAEAKRYLCATEPGYWDVLSPVSRRTLAMQGGVMTVGEAESFRQHPWLGDVLALRRWDDRAKVAGKRTRPLSAWAPLLERHLGQSSPGRARPAVGQSPPGRARPAG
jgi:predicted HD phosphohydrolase